MARAVRNFRRSCQPEVETGGLQFLKFVINLNFRHLKQKESM